MHDSFNDRSGSSGCNFEKIRPIIKNQAVNLQTNKIRMPQRIFTFIVVFLLIFPRVMSAQQNPVTVQLINTEPSGNYVSERLRGFKISTIGLPARPTGIHFFSNRLLKPVSAFSYADQPGFFCKKELQLEALISLPLRFRLGSLDYVNWLEQKPNALKPLF